MNFDFEAPVNGAAVLEQLLESSGVPFRREGQRFRFWFSSQGRRWQMVCDCNQDRVLLYSLFPLAYEDRATALESCDAVNRQVVQGGCFLSGDRLVFRTGAELFEPFVAEETLARALEYNAAVMVTLWGTLAEGAGGPPGTLID